MKKKKSPSVKAIVDKHLNDKNDVIKEEDMKNMKLGVERESVIQKEKNKIRRNKPVSGETAF